jgi:serine/threonine protein kinase
MLTGCAAFSGKDVSDVLAAVIRAEPEWNNLPANLHWRLREVLERCLKKDLKNRYHDISDVRVDIQKVLTDFSSVLVHPATTEEHRLKLPTMYSWIAAVVLISVITGAIVWKLRAREPRQVMRFDYQLTEDQQFAGLFPVAVSRDGKQFVFSTPKGLYLRSMDD